MRASTAFSVAPAIDATPLARGLDRRLRAALADIADEFAAVEAGRLVSFSLALPGELFESEPRLGGDSRWLSPHEHLALYGSGVAVRFDGHVVSRFRAESPSWRRLGAAAAPLAFFTVPPATAAAKPELWVPRVLLRRSRAGDVLTWTARRDATSPELVLRAWLREARRLFARASGGEHGYVLETSVSPDADVWRARVRAAQRAMAEGRLDKVVLARRLSLSLSRPADAVTLAERLAQLHPECRVFALPHGRGRIVAASPERLASRRGRQLVSHALAGTVRRYSPAAALTASAKERREHAIVVEAIAARMAELCEAVEPPPPPKVWALRFVQHLLTPLTGLLRPGLDLLDAVLSLHPTPAVLGQPAAAARDWLHDAGERRDGLYTGVAGWVDADGDGDAQVILRSAYLEGDTAVLWAGAGIMAESDPDAELAETEMKLATMLEVLGSS